MIELREQCRHVLVSWILSFERAEIRNPEFWNCNAADRPRERHRERRDLALDAHGPKIERPVRDKRPAQASPREVPDQIGWRIPQSILPGQRAMPDREYGAPPPR